MLIQPSLQPGDYMLWHPDVITSLPSSSMQDGRDTTSYDFNTQASDPVFLSVPVCPLTEANAQFLVQQRRAFVLGFPGPEYSSGEGDDEAGESGYLGRPGVHEVHCVGGEDGLRVMGLLAWNEDDSNCTAERHLLRIANSVLFPDLL